MRQGEAAFVDRGSEDRIGAVTQKFVDQFNMEILTSSPETFAGFQKVEQMRWTKIIKDNDTGGLRSIHDGTGDQHP